MDILEQYEKMTYSEANTRLQRRFNKSLTSYDSKLLPPLTELKARRAFDEGDHWQLGEGFIGQLPTGSESDTRTELLRKAYVPEEVIAEVLDTHVQNVLGNEPIFAFEGDLGDSEYTDTLEIVKEWFNKRENGKVLADALRAARRETASVLRAFIPSGMIDGEGRIQAKDLADALSKIWIRYETIDKGGVIVDDASATELGLVLYSMRINEVDTQLCEYSYIGRDEATVWGTASGGSLGAEEAEPFLMSGLLPIYQINAKALISNSVCQAQRALNLSGTMLTRNNNLAGSRERLAVGVEPPGSWNDVTDADTGQVTKVFTPAEMATGPATFNFLNPTSIFDDAGRVTAFANPNVIFTDPVAIDTFIGTSMHWRTVIYSKAKMRHLLMADNATASGKSRIEARKEFQASLNESKQVIDPAGRWMIEVALHIAAHFMGSPGKYLNTKVTFDAQVSTIELTPEEKAEIRADYQAGMIDLQTALERQGEKNVDQILERQAHNKPEDGTGITLADIEARLDVANKADGLLPLIEQLRIIFPNKSDAELEAIAGEVSATSAVRDAEQMINA